jgi:hypothetical protein
MRRITLLFLLMSMVSCSSSQPAPDPAPDPTGNQDRVLNITCDKDFSFCNVNKSGQLDSVTICTMNAKAVIRDCPEGCHSTGSSSAECTQPDGDFCEGQRVMHKGPDGIQQIDQCNPDHEPCFEGHCRCHRNGDTWCDVDFVTGVAVKMGCATPNTDGVPIKMCKGSCMGDPTTGTPDCP